MERPDEILTLVEVAADLRCSKSHVANILNGKVAGVSPLPFIPAGRRKLVRRSALENWKRENERKAGHDILRASSHCGVRGRMEGDFHA